MARSSSENPITVYAAIAANLAIAIAKFVAAAFTGSSAMVAEGIHSVIDTGNEGLLLLGVHRSRKPPDEQHPFGYGKEMYFWSLIVAILLFGIGGGLSVYEGWHALQNPEPLKEPFWNYAVLGIALLAEGDGIAERDPEVRRARPPLTMQLAPERVLVNMDIEFRPELSTAGLIGAIDRIEATVRERHPSVERIFLEVEAIRASRGGERHARAEEQCRPVARRS
jgi:divalent metal cation (Fe/Co/Zn/Cd) transporter